MSGPDAIRGFNIQHARALHAALDVLHTPELSVLGVEGDDDVVDYELLDESGRRKEVAQVKSRQAPPWWTPGEILGVVQRWAQLTDADDARFLFISDGAPGPEADKQLLPALERLRHAGLQPEDHEYLSEKELEGHLWLLERTRILLQEPPVGAALEQAELQVLRVLQGRRPISPADASSIVDRLFREISVLGGGGERKSRRVNRKRIAELVGISLEDLDARSEWSPELAERIREAVLARPSTDVLVELGLEPLESEVVALRLDGQQEHSTRENPAESLAELLDERVGAALVGDSGSGKSTSLQELARLSADQGKVPALADTGEYRAGSLFRLLWQRLEEPLQVMLGAGAVETWLNSGQALVLIDGVSERPRAEMTSLLADLRSLRREWPNVSMIVSGRRRQEMQRLGLPVYRLRSLDASGQEQIANQLVRKRDGRLIVHRLRTSLGDATRNPLLLRMGLSLAEAGVEPSSVAEIYNGFLDGLVARAVSPPSEGSLAALGLCSLQLVSDVRFTADGYWWRSQLGVALDRLSEKALFNALPASAALTELEALGVLQRPGALGELRYLHDSFRDFFAARSLLHGHAELPRPLDECFEQVAAFLVGAATPSAELLQRLCDNPVAASAACAIDPQPDDADTVVLADDLLRQLLDTHALPEVEDADALAVRAWRAPGQLYIGLVPAGAPAGTVSDAETFGEDLGKAALVLSLDPDAGPLRMAVFAWQELLRAGPEALRRRARPDAIPGEPMELAEAVVKHFIAARSALRETAEAVCGPLADRLVSEAGWRGILGAVSEESTLDPDTGRSLHGLEYTHDTDQVEVTVGALEDVASSESTFAEFYLRQAPQEVALDQVQRVLGDLLPTWGP